MWYTNDVQEESEQPTRKKCEGDKTDKKIVHALGYNLSETLYGPL